MLTTCGQDAIRFTGTYVARVALCKVGNQAYGYVGVDAGLLDAGSWFGWGVMRKFPS